MRGLIFFVLLVVNCGAAEPSPWPKPAKIKIEFTDTPPEKLPRGLNFNEITVEDREPHTVGLCWLDLNRDGTPELIVDSHEGGTGGSYMQIFAKTRSGFRLITGWQGGIELLVPVNGFYQIETWSSSGGGYYSRALLRYERDTYRTVRLEVWRATDTEEGFEFVRSRDPKENDR